MYLRVTTNQATPGRSSPWRPGTAGSPQLACLYQVMLTVTWCNRAVCSRTWRGEKPTGKLHFGQRPVLLSVTSLTYCCQPCGELGGFIVVERERGWCARREVSYRPSRLIASFGHLDRGDIRVGHSPGTNRVLNTSCCRGFFINHLGCWGGDSDEQHGREHDSERRYHPPRRFWHRRSRFLGRAQPVPGEVGGRIWFRCIRVHHSDSPIVHRNARFRPGSAQVPNWASARRCAQGTVEI